jgi:hypothetical protein
MQKLSRQVKATFKTKLNICSALGLSILVGYSVDLRICSQISTQASSDYSGLADQGNRAMVRELASTRSEKQLLVTEGASAESFLPADNRFKTCPEDTLEQIVKFSVGETRKNEISSLLKKWMTVDPHSAIRKISDLEQRADPSVAGLLYQLGANTWSAIDSYKASSWVDQLQLGRNRDYAVLGLATDLAPTEHEIAITWANSITDVTLKNETLQKVYELKNNK